MAVRGITHTSVLCALLLLLVGSISEAKIKKHYSSRWAVEIPQGGVQRADVIAAKHGLVNHGQVGELKGVYQFSYGDKRAWEDLSETTTNLASEEEVGYVEQQEVFSREKRFSYPSDPQWHYQWSLYNSGQTSGPSGIDLNVVPVWIQGYSGNGVVVSVVDDGLQKSHPDLKYNYDQYASYNFAEDQSDPTPPTYSNDFHGTSCAGEIAMVRNNNQCGAGVAHGCNIGGIRFNLADSTDIMEAYSLSFNRDHIHIYSSSWGPSDSGFSVGGPATYTQRVLEEGAKWGRGGLGSIWVWASGNGGMQGDSCAADSYVTSIYTIAVGSVDQKGKQAFYDENCSSKMAVTYSFNSGTYAPFTYGQVTTTTGQKDCTDTFSGTSASAPLTAGVIALALEANSTLSWRDIQYLIAYTSNPEPLRSHGEWGVNGAGLPISHQFGFGAIDAEAMVTRARNWISVPQQQYCTMYPNIDNGNVAQQDKSLNVTVAINSNNCPYVVFTEHVLVTMTINIYVDNEDYEFTYDDYFYNPSVLDHSGPRRGDIAIDLYSPAGTRSILLANRKNDFVNEEGYYNWPFMSVFHWGENPQGYWNISVSFDSTGGYVTVQNMVVTIYGTNEKPEAISRIPKQCSSVCARGCAAEGERYCDSCKKYRMPDTLRCVSKCPSGLCDVDGYCLECESNWGTWGAIGTVAGVGVVATLALIALLVWIGKKVAGRRGYGSM